VTGSAPTAEPLGSPRRTSRTDLLWFAVWSAIGAICALALVGAMTIGIFALPVAVAAAVLVGLHRRARVGLPGLVSGAALPLLYVAYLNRDGPGTVCGAIDGAGQSCLDEWSPWPWAALGFALLLGGVTVFTLRRRPVPPRSDTINTDS
jgi:hypothetical protein